VFTSTVAHNILGLVESTGTFAWNSSTNIGEDLLLGSYAQQKALYVVYFARAVVLQAQIYPNALGAPLYTTQTALAILFGYNDPLLFAVTQGADSFFAGLVGNTTTQNEAWMEETLSTSSSKYTGSNSNTVINQYYRYGGAPSFVHQSDVYNTDCAVVVAGPPYNQTRQGFPSDCLLWLTPEVITGSYDGSGVPPFQESNTPVSSYNILVTEAARLVQFDYTLTYTFQGITLRRYEIDSNAMSNSLTYPPNAHYDMYEQNCVFPLNRFVGGIDFFLTFPQFYSCQPGLSNTTTNSFTPTYALHGSWVDIEPLSGLSMSVRKRLMLGFILNSQRFVVAPGQGATYPLWGPTGPPAAGTVAKVYLPVYWGQESKDISSSAASSFVSAVYGNQATATNIQIAFVVVGGVGILALAF